MAPFECDTQVIQGVSAIVALWLRDRMDLEDVEVWSECLHEGAAWTNPESLNPKPLNPKGLNPKPKPQTRNNTKDSASSCYILAQGAPSSGRKEEEARKRRSRAWGFGRGLMVFLLAFFVRNRET